MGSLKDVITASTVYMIGSFFFRSNSIKSSQRVSMLKSSFICGLSSVSSFVNKLEAIVLKPVVP